jgi:hypothetical protein
MRADARLRGSEFNNICTDTKPTLVGWARNNGHRRGVTL